MMEEHSPTRVPRPRPWLKSLSVATLVLAVAFIASAATKILDFATLTKNVTDFLNFTQHPALRIAENTTKSDFSDRLTRMAWRRLYWARIFAQRVVDQAPLSEINDAWAKYIDATADWNSDLMIFIVGLAHHYTPRKSEYFEATILPSFTRLDAALREIRLSAAMRKLRSSQAPTEDDGRQIDALFREMLDDHGNLNILLYEFARCFKKGEREVNVCAAQN